GNLHYYYMLLVSWIADMPEECLLAAMSPKASPVTIATSKDFSDPFHHPSCTSLLTLVAIQTACTKQDPFDYKNFLKVTKHLCLKSVIKPCWKGWLLSDPSQFLTPKPLHHFHRMFWDHNTKWCIDINGSAELNFCFSLLQTPVGYCAFEDGTSQLKQVIGCDHCTVQHYIIGAIAGSVPWHFLVAVCSLLDFQYMAQAPEFTDNTLCSLGKWYQVDLK
ncbi:hypothetical protein EDC04DRAFT_2559633, partial [Pisolithus marmoratus]